MLSRVLENKLVEYASLNCNLDEYANIVVRLKSKSHIKEEILGVGCQYKLEKLVDKVLKQLEPNNLRDIDLI